MMTSKIRTCCLVLFLLVSGSVAQAGTLLVRRDGTGDYTTIHEAMGIALLGDTVLVGPGDYDVGQWNYFSMKNGVVLTSEAGPACTWISGDALYGKAIRCSGPTSPLTEISGFHINQVWLGIEIVACRNIVIKRNVFSGCGDGLKATDCTDLDIHTNVFLDNQGTGAGLISSTANLHHNTFYLSDPETQCLYGRGILAYNNIFWGTVVDFELFESGSICNDFYDINDAGRWGGQNFSEDPQLCGPTGGNYYLQSDSPCAPGNPPMDTCGRIGALPVGCDRVPARKMSWGEIKAAYGE